MISNTIQQACDGIINEELKNQFPLSIWQTVSGKQTNINVNEVIVNRSIEILGNKTSVDPIHHVNKNQSSNHTFSTAILQLNDGIYSVLEHLQNVLKNKSEEFSGYIDQISMNIEALKTCQSRLYQLAIDDTVVPTGINTTDSFEECVAQCLARLTGFPFIYVPNKFEELNTYNIMVELSGALNTLAVSLINLTQYEAMAMVASQIMSNHAAVTVCLWMGHSKMNVLKPLIIKNILNSIRILRGVCHSIADHFIVDTKLITNASTSSANEKVFNDVRGARLTAATSKMDYNKYNIEDEELIITSHLNPTLQPDDSSSCKDVSMAPLRRSTLTSNNNLDQASSGQQQQSFVSTQGRKADPEIQ